MNLVSTPDSIQPNKYSCLQNTRSYSSESIRTRPGYQLLFATTSSPITDVSSYATLGTDNLPRYLARNLAGGVYLDTGTLIATMTAPQGYGASMLPWRPSQSPQAWMYIATQGDYRKFSAPTAANAVTNYKVGIAEPQLQVEAAPQAPQFTNFTSNAAAWTPSGSAGATSNSTVFTDTAGTPIADPVIATRLSVPITITYYLIGSLVLVNGTTTLEVQDVLPPVATCSIVAIRYASGTTGPCVIVVGNLPIGEGPTTSTILGSLRRGAIVTLSGGSENVLVLGVATGPNGAVQFECSTTGTHAAAETITGVRAIILDGTVVAGQAITQPSVNSTVAAGTGTLTQNLGTNPFGIQLGSSGIFPTPDDYIRLAILVSNIAAFTQLQIIFVCGSYGTFTYTLNALDNLEAGDLATVEFPISALVPSGTNISLANCTSVQITILTSGTQSLSICSFCISGGGLPDIGLTGAPYQYKIVARSTPTGAEGNASPTMHYGVSPRRQNVSVLLPAVAATLPAADAQVDIWDIYRYGGSVTSYRYIGSGAPSTTFTDKYFDDTALAGRLMPAQNFEPCPSVDVPFMVSSGITVTGNQVVLASLATVPGTILRWLPGTIVLIGGQNAYTLRARPTLITGTTYLLQLVECAGSLSPSILSIAEPIVARQINPYVWGPDAKGYFFMVGDPLRPGVISYAQPFNPDSVPSTNNADICPPSEPLLGGAILGGFSVVASSDRWWQMYPAFNGPNAFTPFKLSVGRGLAAPYGICSDERNVYFWAKDCIAAHSGGSFKSLTEDLFTLFPHEGVPGVNITRLGVTFYAPDYSRAATFRLSVVNGYLYAEYRDSTNTPRTIVCDLNKLDALGNASNCWSSDAYANPVTCRHALEQPEGALTTGAPALYPMMVMADSIGNVHQEKDLTNDNGTAITATVGTFEWDGMPFRQSGIWQDFYIDCLTPSGITATPVQFGAAVVSPTVISGSTSRQLPVISVGQGAEFRFLGLKLTWTDNFTTQSDPTTIFTWRSFADPDVVKFWNTQFTTFGLYGYIHIGRLEAMYASTAVVSLTIAAYDGTSPATITLPSTSGEVRKFLITPTFNKGMLYSLSFSSSEVFQIYGKNFLVFVRQWGSTGGYLPYQIGGESSVKP